MPRLKKSFEDVSTKMSRIVGSPLWFIMSVTIILLWLPTGFLIGFNELWHLLINTFTTIFTFLMMSLLHASQSSWEKKIEQIEMKQEKTLKLLEKEASELKETIAPKKIYNSSQKDNNNQTVSTLV